ncbi:hypothetical protein LINPERHAP1_LOCUS43389 [Linum perenne]
MSLLKISWSSCCFSLIFRLPNKLILNFLCEAKSTEFMQIVTWFLFLLRDLNSMPYDFEAFCS